ncbi:hypothetical protein EV426DRAFT_640013 [Tirmania nivea]|nr:hypothetical protein EV426DRAFT_640013 [Tirmania nivea]
MTLYNSEDSFPAPASYSTLPVENSIPCGHAFAFLEDLQADHIPTTPRPAYFIPRHFRTEIWHSTYQKNILPILTSELAVSNEIQAPTQQQNNRGRPKIKRFQSKSLRKIARAQASLNGVGAPTEYGQRSQACRRCRKYGHNRRTCKAEEQLQMFQLGGAGSEEDEGNEFEEDEETELEEDEERELEEDEESSLK